MVLTSSSGIGASSSSASLIRGTEDLGKAIEAKMDSISRALEADSKENSDSLAKAKADSVRSALKAGNYVGRAQYDKSNFDSWKIDTVYQKSMKEKVSGDWRTPILSHGHAFRDAALTFQMNDTLVGTTRTYSDSGSYKGSLRDEVKPKGWYRRKSWIKKWTPSQRRSLVKASLGFSYLTRPPNEY